ncbi:hypothetical protein C8J37_11011 [Rhizobium sp. PP-WC-1G-195]|nr:hypothetical protein C8J37_11011 [Rhizobium sp. PP-WC-1G-195]TCQ04247.1 hypothetical protein C8J34_10945 [Rhizobium sp. PP-F2F-G36]
MASNLAGNSSFPPRHRLTANEADGGARPARFNPKGAAVDRSASSRGASERWRQTSPRRPRKPVRIARSTATASHQTSGSSSRIVRHTASKSNGQPMQALFGGGGYPCRLSQRRQSCRVICRSISGINRPATPRAQVSWYDLVQRNSEPLLDDGMLGRALACQARKLADLHADRHNLDVARALAADHADRDRSRWRARVETSTRSPSSSSSRMGTSVHAGVTIFVKAGIDAQPSPLAASMRLSRMFPAETIWTGNGRTFGDTSRRDGLSPFAAPSRYRRDGAVGHWPDLATGRHQRQRRRLHASAEAENAQVRSRRCEAPPRRWTCR